MNMKCHPKFVICSLWSVVCGLFLSGCVQAPPPASLTDPWTAPDSSRTRDTVWQDVRTQSADTNQPMSLLALTDLALQNNAATRKAWNEARAASEQVRYAEGYFMPSVTAGAGLNRSTTSAHPDKYDQNLLTYGPSHQLSYLICNFGGGRKAAVEQALHSVYAANFAFNQAIHGTLLSVQMAYFNLISAQAGVEAAATNSSDAKAIFDAATDRRDAGLGVDLDVLQARTGYEQSLFALAEAQGQKKIAQGMLAQALSLPADMALQVAIPTADLPASLSGQDIRRITDDALGRRPDLSALRSTLASREAAIRVAEASRWPSLYATGSISRDYYELYGLRNRDSALDDFAYVGGLSLKWNVFDGLQTLSSIRTAKAQTEAARAQLKQAEVAASAEIWARFQNYETALRKYDFSTMALTTATASHQMALESYKSGVKSILDLLNAENQLAQARSQQIAVRQDVFTALANLAYVTGLIEKGITDSRSISSK